MVKKQEQPPEPFTTSELGLVAFLLTRDIHPIDYALEHGRGEVSYDRDDNLESALVGYVSKCSACGITFSEVDKAFAKGRRILFDGILGL